MRKYSQQQRSIIPAVINDRFIIAERGATAVEFALIAPTLLLLTLGAIDLGRFLYYYQSSYFYTDQISRVMIIALADKPNVDPSVVLEDRLQEIYSQGYTVTFGPALTEDTFCREGTEQWIEKRSFTISREFNAAYRAIFNFGQPFLINHSREIGYRVGGASVSCEE